MVFPRDEELGSGFGGVLNADVDLFNLFTVGIEGDILLLSKKVSKRILTFLWAALVQEFTIIR